MFGISGRPIAAACMQGENGLHGKIKFYPHCDGTLVVAELCGLPASETDFFALHIHEGRDCSGEGFPNTKGHYDMGGAGHPRHAGDLPPLLSCNGSAYLAVVSNRFRIKDIIGRTVVVHGGPDDFKSQPAGNPGSKIACGIICRT